MKTSPTAISRNALGLAGIVGIHAAYAYGTQTQEKIYVLDTYQRVHYGSTVFMLVDGERRHFQVENSLWFWRWDAIEDWHRIPRGYPLTIRRYGWRVAFLGLFPIIVGTPTHENGGHEKETKRRDG